MNSTTFNLDGEIAAVVGGTGVLDGAPIEPPAILRTGFLLSSLKIPAVLLKVSCPSEFTK
jgi:hypothetical protein